MYTDEEIKRLEEEEESLNEEMIAVILLTLGVSESDLKKELRNFYAQYGNNGVITYADARKWLGKNNRTLRLTFLEKIVDDVMDELFDAIEIDFESHLRKIIQNEAAFFKVKIDIDDILQMDWGADVSNWKQRLQAHSVKWKTVLGSDIKLALLKRESIGGLVLKVGKRYESIDYILKRLAYTEGKAVSALTDYECYKKLGVKKYQFLSMNDSITCEQCADLHGRIFPISEFMVGFTANPLHPWCRCRTKPIVE